MYIKSFTFIVIFFLSGIANAKYHYSDYASIRDNFEMEKSQINTKIEQANYRFIQALSAYQKCSSAKWRVKFTTVVPEIENRISALDEYKKSALTRSGSLNSEWLRTAKEHNISQVRPDQDVSDFYYWYQDHISLQRQGPLHELEVYTIALSKLSGVYEKMDSACSGSPNATKDYDLVEAGIRGLLDGVFSLIGKIVSA